jgi:Holliday junction resolvase RusA-like endonuclease
MPELRLEIPGIPPSVGTYLRARIAGKPGKQFVQFYTTPEAKDWKDTVAAHVAGRGLIGETFTVSYMLYLPDARRRDVDNAAKQILDSLVAAGVIHDDSAVEELHAYKRIDRQNPRTVIVVRTEQQQMF